MMRFYTVQAPPEAAPFAADPSRIVFVKEGFCWPALFIAPLWLIYRRMWLVLLFYVLALVGLGFASERADGPLLSAIGVLSAFWFALEANELRRWTLSRRGWRLLGIAGGRRLVDAELGWFARMAQAPSAPSAPAAPPPAPRPDTIAVPVTAAATAETEVIGLFPEQGRTA